MDTNFFDTDFRQQLSQLCDDLRRRISECEHRLSAAPPGELNCAPTSYGYSYYHSTFDPKMQQYHRSYISRKNSALLQALAQKDYDRKFIKTAKQQLKFIEAFLTHYSPSNLLEIPELLSKGKQPLISPVYLTDDIFRSQWEQVSYSPGSFYQDAAEFLTLKGENVRSKSEKIIADTLYQRKIPYRYEYPLPINNQIWRPDFLILNVRTRMEYILEHFGMMDDTEYCNKALGKLKIYGEYGYFPGENLLITMETRDAPLSTSYLNQIIDHYFV